MKKEIFTSALALLFISSIQQDAFAFTLFSKKINKEKNAAYENIQENTSQSELSDKIALIEEIDNEIIEDSKTKTKIKKVKKSKDKSEIKIVEDKDTKTNPKKEKKRKREIEKTKIKSSKEAQGMYETKFPAINSSIEYTDIEGPISLVDCIKLAISNHPSIMSAISNAEIYKSRIGQAWSNYFPTLGAGVSYSRNNALMTSRSALASDKSYDMYYTPTLSASMLLFDFGKTKATADSARRTYESSRYDAEMSIEQVIYNVKVAYYNLIFADIQKIVYEDTVKDFELQWKQADAYFKIGKKAKIDVTTAEYNLGNARVNLIKAKNTLELASVELANAVGIPEMEEVVLKDKLNTKEYQVNFEELLEIAKNSRPSLLSAKKRMDAAELDLRSAKRSFTPDLSAFGGYDNGGLKTDMDYGYQVGLQLNYSGLNLMLLKKQVDESKASYKKSVADYKLEEQNVYLEVKSAYINLLNSKDSVDVSKLALQQAKEQQYQAYRRYQVGLGNAIEFKDAENTYLNARLNYYSNLLSYNVNAAELERVIGAPIKESTEDL